MVKFVSPYWSAKRIGTLVVASIMTAALIGCFAAQQIWAGGMTMHPVIGMWTATTIVVWCAYLASTLRTGLEADRQFRDEALREQIRADVRTEVANLLKPVESQLEEIDHQVGDYGDHCKAEGAALALKIVGGRGNTGRHLTSVPPVE